MDEDLENMTREQLIEEAKAVARRESLDEQLPAAPRSDAPYQPTRALASMTSQGSSGRFARGQG